MHPTNSYVLVGGTLLDGSRRAPIPDAAVEIRGGRIINVCRRADISSSAPEVIDISGTWLMPGLIDAHAHVGSLLYNRFAASDPSSITDSFMRAFLDHGITTVRDTGSPDTGERFRLLKAGRPDWPRFFGSGPNLDGPPGGPWPGLTVVNGPDDAVRQTNQLIDAGVDFLKVYVWMPAETVSAVVATAHARGRLVAAHVGNILTVAEAVRLGVDALEHVRVGFELLTEDERRELAALPPRATDYLISFRPWRWVRPDEARVGELIDLLVERDIVITPTLTLSQAVLRPRTPETARSAGTYFMPHEIQAHWEAETDQADFTSEDWAAAPIELERQLEFIGRAHAAGVRIACGTDTPKPDVVPGYSMHEELRLLVRAGLSPADALVAATGRAAELLRQTGEIGTVTKRARADLLVLDADPTANIANTTRIRAVIKDGEVVSGRLTA